MNLRSLFYLRRLLFLDCGHLLIDKYFLSRTTEFQIIGPVLLAAGLLLICLQIILCFISSTKKREPDKENVCSEAPTRLKENHPEDEDVIIPNGLNSSQS